MKNTLRPNEIYIHPRFAEVDSMNVVHHSRYWVWFEECRFHWVKNVLGISIQELKDLPYYMPIIDSACKYKKPIFWNQEVVVSVKLNHTKAPYFDFRYEVHSYDEKNELLTMGRTKHAIIDLDFNLKLEAPELFVQKVADVKDEMAFAFVS